MRYDREGDMPGMSETPATAALVRNLRASAEDADLIEETEWAALFRAAADALGDRTAIGEGDMPDSLSATVRASLAKMAAPEHDVDVEAEFVAFAEQWLAALCDDNDRLRAQLSAIAEEGTAELNAAVDLRQKLAQARALLREYGRHQPGCSAEFNEPSGVPVKPPGHQYRCRCGWDEAEKTLGAEGREGTR
jgi:hypothetical protein